MEKLLIAETSERFSAALACALQNRYEVHCCATGDAALHLLETLRPQVLILNLALPYMDGLQVLQSGTYQPPAILALTNIATNYILQAVQEAGADFVVMLPCTVQSIVNHVREITRLEGKGKQTVTPQETAEKHLLRLGLSPHLAGFAQLRAGIPLFAQDSSQQLKKELYPAIAEVCGNDGFEQVERSIRQSIKEAWNRGDRSVWAEYFPGRTNAPTNKVFIAVLAQKLRQSDPNRIW